jgi:hypothetical protein
MPRLKISGVIFPFPHTLAWLVHGKIHLYFAPNINTAIEKIQCVVKQRVPITWRVKHAAKLRLNLEQLR